MSIDAFVHVIESPSPSDLLDGRTEGRSLSESMRLAQIPHWYCLATDDATFDESLDGRLRDAWEHFGRSRWPLLHFSMHGNAYGVQLSNGRFVGWHDLRMKLSPLNSWMNGWLLITMSACHGSNGCVMAMHNEQEPTFWALVGNTQAVDWSDAAIAYITFYHSFFKSYGIDDCVERMKVASGDPNFVRIFGSAAKQLWLDRSSAIPTLAPPPAPIPTPSVPQSTPAPTPGAEH